jgi:pilus assembly protein CpaC
MANIFTYFLLHWFTRHLTFALAALCFISVSQPGLCGPHSTIARQPANGGEARALTVGLNKMVFIELPDDAAEVTISDPAVVDAVVKTMRRVHLIGRQTGQATATFIGRNGSPILTLDLIVERDLAPVEATIRRLIPSAHVHLEMLNDNILLTGTVATPLDATNVADIAGRFVAKREQVLNMLSVATKEQVLLRVTVTEMNRSVLRRLGVDIRDTLTAGSFSAVKIAENAFPVTGGMVATAALDSVGSSGVGQTLGLSGTKGNHQIDALVQALEREGLARTLAEPNLTSVSGETANFLAGGEYPVPTGSDKEGTSVTFKPFGVSLGFTPVVLSDGRISLKVATEMSELTSDGAVTMNNIAIPALKVRRASSTLELPSGGSMVMAGLLSSQTRRSAEGLPGLKQLPVLGALFRSDDFLRSETELVVIVTPYLVRPVAKQALAEAGSGAAVARAPDDEVGGQIASSWTEKNETDDDFGFIVE